MTSALAITSLIFSGVTAMAAGASVLAARASERTARKLYADAKWLYQLGPKRDALRRVVAQSHLFTEGVTDRTLAMEALNESAIAFGDDEEVMVLLARIKDKLDLMGLFDPLVRTMAKAAELSLAAVPEAWFHKPFVSHPEHAD